MYVEHNQVQDVGRVDNVDNEGEMEYNTVDQEVIANMLANMIEG